MPRVKDPNKPKRGFMDYRRSYNPEVEGYGNAAQWKNAFKTRLGIDAAREAVGNDTPRSILGVSFQSTWDEIKSAYWKLAKIHHPDKGGDPATFRKIQGAFEMLEAEFNKG